jgi:hypothetical protein
MTSTDTALFTAAGLDLTAAMTLPIPRATTLVLPADPRVVI